MAHQLDGKYIVLKYTECDGDAEGSCLAFFKLNGDNLESIVLPAGLYEPSQ